MKLGPTLYMRITANKLQWIFFALFIAYLLWRPPAWVDSPYRTSKSFSVQLIDGQRRIDFADLHGRVVLVNVWATWCPTCRREFPAMADYFIEHQDEGLVILALAKDSRNEVKKFTEEHAPPFPIALWQDCIGCEENFGSPSRIPTSYLIDRNGTLTHRIVGPLHAGRLQSMLGPLLKEKVDAKAK